LFHTPLANFHARFVQVPPNVYKSWDSIHRHAFGKRFPECIVRFYTPEEPKSRNFFALKKNIFNRPQHYHHCQANFGVAREPAALFSLMREQKLAANDTNSMRLQQIASALSCPPARLRGRKWI
jgi:hypothetical protein